MPKISVITVNFNNAAGLERSLSSVTQQSYTDWESIVIDGGSVDGSKEVIGKYESKISHWVSEADHGAYHAMNKGIAKAKGDYLLFLNSGDHFFNNRVLEQQAGALSGNDIIAFDILVKGSEADIIKQHPDRMSFGFLFNDTLAHQSVCIKKSLFDRLGTYDESLSIVSDWKFFLQAIYKGASYKAVHEVLSVYYLDGMSATAAGTFKRREEREQVLTNDYGLLYEDYQRLALLETNRFKMLKALEDSKIARKLNSAWLRSLLRVFKNKSVNDL
jgi:glycosyltransferase involved in cell wall biosynthesis